jgi:DNA-binding response OmpR family regulator
MRDDRPVVLIVEDDAVLSEIVQTLLEDDGFLAEVVEDGPAALTRMGVGDIDVVVLDLMLPTMDGLEICRRLRSRDEEVYVPIIILTAMSSEARRHQGFAAGADDYLTKPFNALDLLDRVQVWWCTRRRLLATHERLMRQQEALREAERARMTAQVDGIRLAARELAHLINNDLTVAVGVMELLRDQYKDNLPVPLHLVEQAAIGLGDATRHIEQLQHVARIETQETPVGPALDLMRSL